MNRKQKRLLTRVVIAFVLFVVIELLPLDRWLDAPYSVYAEFVLFLVPYLIAGHDVLRRAARNITKGMVFDENFLMSIATIGAFALVAFPDSDPHMAEGAAVMIFYQVGELFEGYAVGRTRSSIADMMDIAPDYANVMGEDGLEQVDPYEVMPGDLIVVKPGERVPLDGVVEGGSSTLDTAALTGESLPRPIAPGDEISSGCVNLSGVLSVRVSKPFETSTVSRILELVENAAEKKARSEAFITRFARYYTPVVVVVAVLLAVLPPLLFGQSWSGWIERALCFLVVSCPCALVISVPLSFFGGIGAASRAGILVKGSSYLEALAAVDTVVFDKTGTLTTGRFAVAHVLPAQGMNADSLLDLAAHAETYSDHPLALSVKEAFGGTLDAARVADAHEIGGKGVRALVDGREVLLGNAALLQDVGAVCPDVEAAGTVLHLAVDGAYGGTIVVADVLKEDSAIAIQELHKLGVRRCVMLTGDTEAVAAHISDELGIDEHHAGLMPQDKVFHVERLLAEERDKAKLAFVGDGINDAPVLARSDIGIAMGALGSDAAIEAADIVLMDDKPSKIARAVRLARRTMRIVWQNIYFAIGVKLVILVLAAVGLANMWMAVFGDVGVAVIAILNAMRCLRAK